MRAAACASTPVRAHSASTSSSEVSLAPGTYSLTVTASGFNAEAVPLTLLTGQNLNLPITLRVASATQTLEVTAEAPVLNAAESRNQLTLTSMALTNLPLAGRNMISLVTVATGVVGLGTVTGGSPGSRRR